MPTDFVTLDEALHSLRRPGDVHVRLAALRAIVEHWHGPIRPEDGVSEDELAGLALPYPLSWWYRWAGRRTSIMSGQNFLFSPVDAECPHWQLRPGGDRLVFYVENQYCYQWSTLPEGRDPPVFGREDDNASWMTERVSLSEHLILACLLEIVMHAPAFASTCSLSEDAFEAIAGHVPALAIGPWRWCDTRFHAGSETFMISHVLGEEKGRLYHSVYIGAKHSGSLGFLEPFLDGEWDALQI